MVIYSIRRMDRLLNTPTLWKNFISGLFNHFQEKTTTKTNKHCAVTSWHFFLDDWMSAMCYWNGLYCQDFFMKSLRLLSLIITFHATLIRAFKSSFSFGYIDQYPCYIAVKKFPHWEMSINFGRALLLIEFSYEPQIGCILKAFQLRARDSVTHSVSPSVGGSVTLNFFALFVDIISHL